MYQTCHTSVWAGPLFKKGKFFICHGKVLGFPIYYYNIFFPCDYISQTLNIFFFATAINSIRFLSSNFSKMPPSPFSLPLFSPSSPDLIPPSYALRVPLRSPPHLPPSAALARSCSRASPAATHCLVTRAAPSARRARAGCGGCTARGTAWGS